MHNWKIPANRQRRRLWRNERMSLVWPGAALGKNFSLKCSRVSRREGEEGVWIRGLCRRWQLPPLPWERTATNENRVEKIGSFYWWCLQNLTHFGPKTRDKIKILTKHTISKIVMSLDTQTLPYPQPLTLPWVEVICTCVWPHMEFPRQSLSHDDDNYLLAFVPCRYVAGWSTSLPDGNVTALRGRKVARKWMRGIFKMQKRGREQAAWDFSQESTCNGGE